MVNNPLAYGWQQIFVTLDSKEPLVSEQKASLDWLGIKFGTDKSSIGHDYLNFYERYLASIREHAVKILEIGILGGASLAVWESYFQNGVIIGADIDKTIKCFAHHRVKVEIIDQSNIEHLTQIALKHGPFDVIIDDGSHMWEHQITTLRTLFPFLKNTAFYIVEDLQTNFGSMAADYRGVASISCVEYLKKLVDFRVGCEQVDCSKEEDAFLRTYGRAMNSINFFRHACLIEKTSQENSADEALLAIEDAQTVPVSLLAHLATQGDKVGKSGWVRATRRPAGIQGFSINVQAGIPCQLRYRARSAAGVWSEWACDGKFVGTRGLADNLTGFSVQLAEESQRMFTLQAIGQFAASPDIIEMHTDDCVSSTGRHPLVGMQVVVRPRHTQQ